MYDTCEDDRKLVTSIPRAAIPQPVPQQPAPQRPAFSELLDGMVRNNERLSILGGELANAADRLLGVMPECDSANSAGHSSCNGAFSEAFSATDRCSTLLDRLQAVTDRLNRAV